MSRIARLLARVAPLLLTACATPRGAPMPMTIPGGPPAAVFTATGEFRASIGKSAAFDGWRVVGPLVNLARNADGSWDGTAGLEQAAVHLVATPGELRGPNLVLGLQRLPDGTVEVGGILLGERALLRVTPSRVAGHLHDGRCAFEFRRASPALLTGEVVCGLDHTPASIELLGLAARLEDPVLPQAALALLAVMP